MANLGNLFFSLGIRDNTDADWDKIIKRIEKRSASIGITVDGNKLHSQINNALSGKKYTIDLSAAVKDNEVEAAIRRAYSRLSNIGGVTTQTKPSSEAQLIRASAYADSQKALERSRNALAELREARLRDAEATRRQKEANDALRGSMVKTNSLASQLRNEILGVYSIYTVQNFLRSIIEIGGEFEKQRLALGSILQDVSHATELFSQIKNLAVVSPFGIRELTGYSKQLAAFNIPYSELYETTKRLADISAGVGVDMGRIILAYGQVRSAQFLRGAELRQFTEAGIPLVQALADKFSELEGRVISAGEVIEMISKRKVSFEDVRDVLWGMTGEGGIFNNMQEVLAESLSGKWSNLKDAYDIMLSEIAESNNSILKGSIEGLTSLMKHWQDLVPLIMSTAASYGVYRVALVTANRLHGEENAMTVRNALLLKQKQADNLRLAQTYRSLTAAEQGLVASSGRMATADWQQLAASGRLTKEYALRLMALGRLKTGQAGHIAQVLNISRAEMSAALHASRWRMAMASLGMTVRNLGIALKSLVFNPFTAIFTLFSVAIETYSVIQQKQEAMQQSIQELTQKAQSGYKALTDEMKALASVDTDNVYADQLIQSIKQAQQALKDYAPDANNILKQADGISDLAKRFEYLRDAVKNTTEAYKGLVDIRSVSENANKATDGWFDESLKDNIRDYIDAINEVNSTMSGIGRFNIEISEAISKAAKGNADFAKAIQNKSLEEQVKVLPQYMGVWMEVQNTLYKTSVGAAQAMATFAIRNKEATDVLKNDVMPDLKQYAQDVRNQLQAKGWDFSALSESQVSQLRLIVNDMLSKIEGMTPEIQRQLGTQVLTVEYQIEPVIAQYTESNLLTTLAQKIKDAQSGGKEESPITLFTDKELEAMSSSLKVVEAFEKKRKELESSLKAARRVKGNEEEVKALQKELDALNRLEKDILNPEKDTSKGKDEIADLWKNRIELMKQAEAEYKKWAEIVGKEEAERKLEESGVFAGLGNFDFSNARKEIEKFVSEISGKATTGRQKDVVRSGLQLLLGFSYDENKDQLDKTLKEIERHIQETTKKWDVYKQLFAATGDNGYSIKMAFTDVPYWDEAATSMREELNRKMDGKGIKIKIDFTETEEETKKIFGGENSELYKLWNETKKRIEKNGIDLKINTAKAIEDTMGIAERIRSKEMQKSKTLASIPYMEGTKEYEAIAKKFDNEILELKASLFELSPAFKQIFQDTTGLSIRQIENLRKQAQDLLDMINASGTPVLDENKQVKGYQYTDKSGSKAYIDKKNYDDVQKRIEKLGKKAGDVRIAFGRMWDWITGKDVGGDQKLTFRDIAKDLSLITQEASGAAESIGNMFGAMGNDDLADGFAFAGEMLNSIGSMAQGIASGNPFAVIGGLAQAVTSVIKFHDKKLQRQIEASQLESQRLQNIIDQIDRSMEYYLGNGKNIKLLDAENDIRRLDELNAKVKKLKNNKYITFFDLDELQSATQEIEKLQKRVDAYQEGGAYGYQRQLLEEQYAELKKQRQLEIDKKDTDESKIADYDAQISELRDQITRMAQDVAQELYNIDFKGWSSELGDALFEAWKKGEDGAEAFREKAGEILADVMNQVFKIGYLEPMMQNLSDYLFGTESERKANGGKGGAFGTDFELDESEIKHIGDQLMGMSEASGKYTELMDSLNKYLERYGQNLKDDTESSSGLSTGIKGITEETGGLLASYVNAIRADVGINREYMKKLVEDTLPGMSKIASAQLKQLEAIVKNTKANAESAAEIANLLQRNIQGINKFNIG